MATASKLKNQKMHKTNMKKHRKQVKKELSNRKEKKQKQVTQEAVVLGKPRTIGTSVDAVERMVDSKPVSPARRAFQDV